MAIFHITGFVIWKISHMAIFHITGFVPYLTKAEEEAYVKDPAGFSATMATAEWLFHSKRSYFVCDGATRYTLCLANDFGLSAHFLHPSIPYYSMTKLAISSNEV